MKIPEAYKDDVEECYLEALEECEDLEEQVVSLGGSGTLSLDRYLYWLINYFAYALDNRGYLTSGLWGCELFTAGNYVRFRVGDTIAFNQLKVRAEIEGRKYSGDDPEPYSEAFEACPAWFVNPLTGNSRELEGTWEEEVFVETFVAYVRAKQQTKTSTK